MCIYKSQLVYQFNYDMSMHLKIPALWVKRLCYNVWLEYIIFKHGELLCTQFPLPPRELGFEVYSGSGLECDASHAQLLTCLCQGRKPVKLKPSHLSCSSLLHFFSIGNSSIMWHYLIGDQVAVLFESIHLS